MAKELISPRFSPQPDGTYIMRENYFGQTAILDLKVSGENWSLQPDGTMVLMVGFVWNGPDVVLDHPLLMIPSALHDAGCYGLSSGLIPKSHAKQVHYTYRDAMKTWGVPRWRRVIQFRAVRHGHGLYSRIMGWFGK